MIKYYKVGWISAFFLGIVSIMCPGILADKARPVSSQVLQCETSLKEFCKHLEGFRTRGNQAYYENLYQQTQDFLKTLQNLPTNSLQLGKCENFVKAIRDIIGSHAVDLAPMPSSINPSTGRMLTRPALETTISTRPLRRPRPIQSIQYVYGADKKKQQEGTDEETKVDELLLTSRAIPSSSKTKKPSATEEPKELE